MKKVLVVFAAITFCFTACNEPKPTPPPVTVCQCPAGTIHLAGEADCGGTDCECEKNVAGTRVEGIAVTNREGVANFTEMVTRFTTAFNNGDITDTQRTWMKNNLKEVKIILGTSGTSLVNGILTIQNATSAPSIKDYLEQYFWDNSIGYPS
ncbi:MAG: hypothetical protein LBG94_10505 [Treponema sp.]|nr:hypothetical protein [Treponema sp.]